MIRQRPYLYSSIALALLGAACSSSNSGGPPSGGTDAGQGRDAPNPRDGSRGQDVSSGGASQSSPGGQTSGATGTSRGTGTVSNGSSPGESSVQGSSSSGAGTSRSSSAPPPVDAGHDAAKPECTGTGTTGCDGGICVSGTCVAASCDDHMKDGNETDVDCGGSCPPCGTGLHCGGESDCVSLDCQGGTVDGGTPMIGVCQAASCSDHIKNEGESDIDCGGAACPACGVGKACTVAKDCASGGCDYNHLCALAPSCTQHHGGDTCGAGEDTDLGSTPMAATGEESCCTTIAIPGTQLTLDKYLITAGRMRAFVNAFAGNVRSFTESIPASNTNWNPQWNQYIPSTTDEVDLQLGPYPAPLTPDPYPPSDTDPNTMGEPTGNWLGQWRDGCTMGGPGSPDGARTWWTDHKIGSDQAPVAYPQDYLDDKFINCIDSYMLTAFCIWDGGHLATGAEMAAAWGPGPFPWSGVAPGVLIDQSSQEPTGTDSMGRDASSYVSHEFGLTPDEFVAPFTYTYDPYGIHVDNSVHIPPPGRFPLGAGPYGHMDMAGATYEALAIKAGTDGQEPPPSPPTVVTQVDNVGTVQGGSWEIHPIISGAGAAVVYDPWMPAYWAYWAMGSRCGR